MIKHECGVALLHLRKPLQHFIDRYGDPAYPLAKMYLLLQKQYNRGQDGIGIANVKYSMPPGHRYVSRYRSVDPPLIDGIFSRIERKYSKARDKGDDFYRDAFEMKRGVPFTGEAWLGHLRYSTHSENVIGNCHPALRRNNWRSRTLLLAGNFNMTNVDELFGNLVTLGQYPKGKVDTITVLEKIGHFLDVENDQLFAKYRGQKKGQALSDLIERELDLVKVVSKACKDFDGGYTIAGIVGYGSSFVARDPNGIRPAYYYYDDEVVAVASEKPPIKAALKCNFNDIREIPPGHVLLADPWGEVILRQFQEAQERRSCSFERIYFSRSTDPDIYSERKALGRLLVPDVLETLGDDLDRSLFSYIPNTSEVAFLGMIEGIQEKNIELSMQARGNGQKRVGVSGVFPRVEKLIYKDLKLRTFIADDESRNDLVSHVYDTTYELTRKGEDVLVILDDSIVRGTTLEQSILEMLARLQPRKIIIVSSAPQIRYPDCYGIDMSRMKDFVAFRAVMELLREHSLEDLVQAVYEQCQSHAGEARQTNYVRRLYEKFTHEEVSGKIAQIIKPSSLEADLVVVFQKVENLHAAIPEHAGDWYFTGNYPTIGGNRVVNKAFVNYMEKVEVRSYT